MCHAAFDALLGKLLGRLQGDVPLLDGVDCGDLSSGGRGLALVREGVAEVAK